MASDRIVLIRTAKQKLIELMDLGYPKKLLQIVGYNYCSTIFLCCYGTGYRESDSRNPDWLQVRDLMYETHYRPKAGMVDKGLNTPRALHCTNL